MKNKATSVLVVIAGISVILAIIIGIIYGSPGSDLSAIDTSDEFTLGIDLDEPMFPELKENTDLKSIEIISYDTDNQQLNKFQLIKTKYNNVAENTGSDHAEAWSIKIGTVGSEAGQPHYYPADKVEAIGKLTSAFIDLKYNKQVGFNSSTHENLELINPEDPEVDAITPRGKRVIIKDAKDNVVVDAILGIKDEVGFTNIRKTNNNYVFAVPLKTELDTSFTAWVEDDLLKIEKDDIQSMTVNPYQVELVPVGFGQVGLDVKNQNQQFAFNHDGTDWVTNHPVPPGKEFQKYQAGTLTSSLDNLKIAGVDRKSVV
jgi:hypothetical protein